MSSFLNFNGLLTNYGAKLPKKDDLLVEIG